MKIGDIFSLIKETVAEWSEDKATRLSAALAYAAVFSIPPLILLLLVVLGRIVGAEFTEAQIQTRLLDQFAGLIGPEGADLIASVIENASEPGEGLLAGAVAIVTLAIGATGFFTQLQDSMNTIWEVKPAENQGIVATLKNRLFSFSLVAGMGLLLLLSLAVSAVLSALNEFVSGLLPEAEILMRVVNFIVSLAIITLLFAAVYKVIPDVHIAWRDVWIGAVVTALLFGVGKWAIGLYLGQSSTASTYGAAGSMVVFLLWMYYSAAIFFFGAEFTQVYARRFGSQIRPAEGAVRVTEEDRAQQGMTRQGPQAAPAGATLAAQPYAVAPAAWEAPRRREDEGAVQYYIVAVLALVIGVWRWLRS